MTKKNDALTHATNPLGNSSLEGAEFLVWTRTNARRPSAPTAFLDP